MSKSNVKSKEATITTHEGAPASKESAEKELTRTVSCLLLFEDAFYESGKAIAARIESLCEKVSIKFLCDLAVKARTELKLRHAPLFLMIQALKKKGTPAERNLVGQALSEVIRRADELAEILAIYWKDGRKKVPRQLKAGIAKAFPKFNAYNLAKYNRDGAVKLRDALFISHAKPKDQEQAEVWKKLIEGKLEAPDTWEVQLSAGKDKKETFSRLITEGKLGYLALLRNLRNMEDTGVDRAIVKKALLDGAKDSVALPFRFITAAKYAPQLEETLGQAMTVAAEDLPKLPGRTLVVVDVSGSMQASLSSKSEMNRVDAACGLAIMIREQSEEFVGYATAGNDHTRVHATALVPPRRAFALRDAIATKMGELGGGGIFMVQVMKFIQAKEKNAFDRVIIITDEQDCDISVRASEAPKLGKQNYIINVGVYEPALPVTGAGWTRITGFSERVLEWIKASESDNLQ
jgi:hypothetical protein